MTDEPGPRPAHIPGEALTVLASERAPIVYFDGVTAIGMHKGAVQIELAANVLGTEAGATKTLVVAMAHIRCSPAAAIALRDSINNLALLVAPTETEAKN